MKLVTCLALAGMASAFPTPWGHWSRSCNHTQHAHGNGENRAPAPPSAPSGRAFQVPGSAPSATPSFAPAASPAQAQAQGQGQGQQQQQQQQPQQNQQPAQQQQSSQGQSSPKQSSQGQSSPKQSSQQSAVSSAPAAASSPTAQAAAASSPAAQAAAASSSSSSSGSNALGSAADIAAAIKVHNDARALYGYQPLVHNTSQEINNWAQVVANNCSSHDALIHSGAQWGENLYQGWSVNHDNYERGVRYMLHEDCEFSAGEGFSEATGHFSQIVWPETTSVAFGFATGSDGKLWMAYEYWPPGNVEGQVAIPAGKTIHCDALPS